MFADFTFKIPFEERIRLIKENGIDGVMLGFSDGQNTHSMILYVILD